MRGSVFKRCQCRDDAGKRIKNCRKAHGSWAFTVDAGRDPLTGKRKQIPRSGFRTRDDAETALTKELAKLDAGTWTDDRGTTVGEWLDQWLDELTTKGRAVKTLANYRSHIRDAWKPRLGHFRLRDLRRSHIEKVLTDLAKPLEGDRPTGNVGRRVTKRTPDTIEGYRRTIRAALAAAVRRELITHNPAQGRLDALALLPRSGDDGFVIWELDETARFLEHVISDRLSALYELAAYAGLRRAELCGLRWTDIDEDGSGLTVRQTIVEVSSGQTSEHGLTCAVCGADHPGRLFKPPKSRAGRRWVPLAQPARDALARHHEAQQTEKEFLGDDYDDHGLVFCEPTGLPLRPGSVTTAFTEHVKTCGLPIIRLHDTRHGACSLMLAGGVPIEIVQLILGHSSPAITRKIYTHVMRKATAAQVESATKLLTAHRPARSDVSNP